MPSNSGWHADRSSWKDLVECARAVGRDPYTLGIPAREVRAIMLAQDLTVHAAVDIPAPPCVGEYCPCGARCYRLGVRHVRHRCETHRWVRSADDVTRSADTAQAG
jgi:hypothetical protein